MYTRVPTFVTAAVLLAGASLAFSADEPPKPALQPGKELPGAFEAFCVSHPDAQRVGKFHSPVCEFGLNPAVLVFVNEANDPDSPPALGAFLKKLDEAVARHQDASMGGCAVFLNDGGYREALEHKTDDLAKATEARQAEEAKLKDVAKKGDLKLVALSLDSPAGPKGYVLDPKANLTVLLVVNQQLRSAFTFTRDKPLAEKDAYAILAEVEKMAPPKRAPDRGRPAPRRKGTG
jgi:hypothetical protein